MSISEGYIGTNWANVLAQGVSNGVDFDFTTFSGSLYLGIYIGDPFDDVEMSGGSYSRQLITLSTVGATPAFQSYNTNTITFSNVPAGNIGGWGLFYDSTDPDKLLYRWENTTGAGFPGTYTEIPVSDGDTVVLPPSTFTFGFA